MLGQLFRSSPSVVSGGVLAVLLMIGCAAKPPDREKEAIAPALPSVVTVIVNAGQKPFPCDLYAPHGNGKAPLVVVAHGFSRTKSSMAEWGKRVAEEGFFVAVPTLPAWSDHAGNAKAIRQLIDWLAAHPDWGRRIDARGVGLLGFSAGGLATLLAAVDGTRVGVWVGLDPVDSGGRGAAAAARLSCPWLVLRAEPHACNANGNASRICQALPAGGVCLLVKGATHTDAEWPTDPMAEWVCGESSQARREVFVQYAVDALRAVLLGDDQSAANLSRAMDGPRVTVLGR